jgi:transcriptional regulator with XRE-family HTH domain
MSESDVPGSSDTPTQDLGSARRAAGLTRRELARRSGVPKRTLAAIERGTRVASTEQSAAIASACADASIAPPEAPVLDPVATTVAPDDTVALDDLLREYIAMVVELRSTTVESFGSLRVEDLTVLAGALGSSPETIEARIMELLGTEASRASEMRGAILPSTTSLHRPLFTT